MSDYLDLNNEELLKDFFAEAEQQVENLESNILVIENDPTNHDAVDEIFRAAHTLKGVAGNISFTEDSTYSDGIARYIDVRCGGNADPRFYQDENGDYHYYCGEYGGDCDKCPANC